MNPSTKKQISLFALVMINVIAIGNLRTLPFAASFGASMVSYYLIAACFFFIPTCWITMELATTWPNKGGICVWVEQAFGPTWGFTVIWLQWLCNVIWYPTTLMFIAAMLADLIAPNVLHQKLYQWLTVIGLFWFATYSNSKGMKISSQISTLCALLGTLLPMACITFFAIKWHMHHQPEAISWSWSALIPHTFDWHMMPNFVAMVFGLIGIEMSAIHAHEVINPARNFPRAVRWSALLILLSLTAASLSIAAIIPQQKINLILGAVQAFTVFFHALHMPYLLLFIMIALIIGSFGSLSAWLIGPSKGLAVALKNNPKFTYFSYFNKDGVPTRLLITQACIVSLLASFIYLLPTQAIYTLFTVIAAQLYLIAYIIFFCAAIKLRSKYPSKKRPYRVPGGSWLIRGVAYTGLVACLLFIALGFIPPKLSSHDALRYEWLLALGMIICGLPHIILIKYKNKNR